MNSKILISGDWHGSLIWAKAVVNRAYQLGITTIYHVGDFGYMGKGGMFYTSMLAEYAKSKGVKIWVTPGNHENWKALYEFFEEFGDGPADVTGDETIFFLPPGFRWELNGVSFLSLGGAPSIDRNYRIPGMDWWHEETITEDEAKLAVEGGPVGIMLTHDAPDYFPGRVYDIIYGNYVESSKYWGAEVMRYCMEGHRLLHEVYEAVQPKALFHGHYHVWDHWTDASTGQNIVSLEHEGRRRNTVILDLEAFKDDRFEIKPSGAYIR